MDRKQEKERQTEGDKSKLLDLTGGEMMNSQEEKDTALDAKEMTFESWTRQKGETSRAFAAFCAYRDYGPERNIKKALMSVVKDEAVANRKYGTWRNWSCLYHWKKRAGDYDKYMDSIRLMARRRLKEEREEVHRILTEKMNLVLKKKLDTMSPEELTQEKIPEWVKTVVHTEREILGFEKDEGGGKQGQIEIVFDSDFDGV